MKVLGSLIIQIAIGTFEQVRDTIPNFKQQAAAMGL
jgi:hypothetical protein